MSGSNSKVYCVRKPNVILYKVKTGLIVNDIDVGEVGGRAAARKKQIFDKLKYEKNDVKFADPSKDGPRSHGKFY